MKRHFIVLLSLFMAVAPINILSENCEGDRAHLTQVIQELEQELVRVTNLRDYYLNAWVPSILPWGYEIILNKYRIKIIKDIYYFKDLLKQSEAIE